MTLTNDQTAINFHDELYIGCRSMEPFSTTEFPLAFSTPYDNTAAGRKRQKTVDDWCGVQYHTKNPSSTRGSAKPQVVKNELLEGFKFEGAVSRWRTGNKWFEINDPRGFTLQISAANLADIILNCTIINGVLQGKYVWGRRDGSVYLARESQLIKVASADRSRPNIGDIVKDRYGTQYVYLGKYFTTMIIAEQQYFDFNKKTYSIKSYNKYYEQPGARNWASHLKTLLPNNNYTELVLEVKQSDKATHVYKPVTDYSLGALKFMSDYGKHEKTGETEVVDVDALLAEWHSSDDISYSATKLFRTKDERSNFVISTPSKILFDHQEELEAKTLNSSYVRTNYLKTYHFIDLDGQRKKFA
jgi:hypothetical protein